MTGRAPSRSAADPGEAGHLLERNAGRRCRRFSRRRDGHHPAACGDADGLGPGGRRVVPADGGRAGHGASGGRWGGRDGRRFVGPRCPPGRRRRPMKTFHIRKPVPRETEGTPAPRSLTVHAGVAQPEARRRARRKGARLKRSAQHLEPRRRKRANRSGNSTDSTEARTTRTPESIHRLAQ
jgi:hypothetical protein